MDGVGTDQFRGVVHHPGGIGGVVLLQVATQHCPVRPIALVEAGFRTAKAPVERDPILEREGRGGGIIGLLPPLIGVVNPLGNPDLHAGGRGGEGVL